MNCIFCKIISGELPSAKIFEDSRIISILDINPISTGHTLVITKKHYPTLIDTPVEILTHLMENTHKITKAVISAMTAEGYNLIVNNNKCAGQLIPHLHFHIIPRKKDDKVNFNWTPRSYNDEQITEVAKSIKRYLPQK